MHHPFLVAYIIIEKGTFSVWAYNNFFCHSRKKTIPWKIQRTFLSFFHILSKETCERARAEEKKGEKKNKLSFVALFVWLAAARVRAPQ